MPATFDSFGIKFLYPDNWKIVDRSEDEGEGGVTIDLPSGGFFSIERVREGQLDEEVIEEVADLIEAEYKQVEREEIVLAGASDGERAVDYQFYYLDLVINSRLVLMTIGEFRHLVQFQAESRDFDANELVFEAILKQIRV